jgi:hypothetical protein
MVAGGQTCDVVGVPPAGPSTRCRRRALHGGRTRGPSSCDRDAARAPPDATWEVTALVAAGPRSVALARRCRRVPCRWPLARWDGERSVLTGAVRRGNSSALGRARRAATDRQTCGAVAPGAAAIALRLPEPATANHPSGSEPNDVWLVTRRWRTSNASIMAGRVRPRREPSLPHDPAACTAGPARTAARGGSSGAIEGPEGRAVPALLPCCHSREGTILVDEADVHRRGARAARPRRAAHRGSLRLRAFPNGPGGACVHLGRPGRRTNAPYTKCARTSVVRSSPAAPSAARRGATGGSAEGGRPRPRLAGAPRAPHNPPAPWVSCSSRHPSVTSDRRPPPPPC